MTKRKFFKTVLTVEVLSEAPLPSLSLSYVAEAIDTGDCSGRVKNEGCVEVDAKKMAELLQTHGSDPEFFAIDKNGKDIDDP